METKKIYQKPKSTNTHEKKSSAQKHNPFTHSSPNNNKLTGKTNVRTRSIQKTKRTHTNKSKNNILTQTRILKRITLDKQRANQSINQ